MSDIPNDRKLLNYLNQFGIGSYNEIGHLLKQMFPYPDDNDALLKEQKHLIFTFLSDLSTHGFIRVFDKAYLNPSNFTVKAAILGKGVEYLKNSEPTTNSKNFVVQGSNINVNYESSSSSNTLSNSDTQKQNNDTPKSSNKILSKIGLVLGIIISLIAIIKGSLEVYKSFTPAEINKVDSTKRDSVKPVLKDSVKQLSGYNNNRKKKKNFADTVVVHDTINQSIPYLLNTPFDTHTDYFKKDAFGNYISNPPITSNSISSTSLSENLNISALPVYTGNLSALGISNTPKPQRHVDSSDIRVVDGFMPSKNYRINIYTQQSDSEAMVFGDELSGKLKYDSIYRFNSFINFTDYRTLFQIDRVHLETVSLYIQVIPENNLVEIWVKKENWFQ